MKNLLFTIIVLTPFISLCRNNPDTLEFYPLSRIENSVDVNEIELLVRADSLGRKDYFFTEQYKGYSGLFLVKKEKGNWHVYNFGLNYGSNTTVKQFKFENNRFVSIQVFRTPSGTCASTYGIIILFDLVNNEWLDFQNYNRFECYNEYSEVSSSSECEVTFSIKEDILKLKSTKKADDGLFCFESGAYRYKNRKFVKVE